MSAPATSGSPMSIEAKLIIGAGLILLITSIIGWDQLMSWKHQVVGDPNYVALNRSQKVNAYGRQLLGSSKVTLDQLVHLDIPEEEAREIIKKQDKIFNKRLKEANGEDSANSQDLTKTSPVSAPQLPANQPVVMVPLSTTIPQETREIRPFASLDDTRHAYQLDARDMWQPVDIVGASGRTIRITTDPNWKTCSSEKAPCADSGGFGDPIPDRPEYQRYVLHNGTATAYSLLGKWGENGQPFVIGSAYNGTIPLYANGARLYLMTNIETPDNYRSWNRGGARITSITIQ